MKTAAVSVSTLCVPCANRCRYCLLSWDGRILGADYQRCKAYVERLYDWLKANRPEISLQFYFGYSMEHPQLLETIDFSNRIGSVGGSFLQFDGLAFRTEEEVDALLWGVQAHGVQLIDLTFYGTRAYHDRFAARKGDFDYMVSILRQANRIGLDVEIGIPVTAENADQLEALLDLFEGYQVKRLFLFIPHGEGRGVTLEGIRLTKEDYDRLSPRVRQYLNPARYKTEGDWVRTADLRTPENRMLGLVLTPENIGLFETMDFEAAIAYLEKLDDDYYAAVPSFPALLQRYGDPEGERFYSERDLYMTYQRRYIREMHLELQDVNDERSCFSRRF